MRYVDYDDLHWERGEYVGDGIPRTAGGVPYNPLADCPRRYGDDEFWNTRQALREVLDFSVGNLVSPYAVLDIVLARVVAATPPYVVLPQYVGAGYGSLNFGVTILGSPGSGKDAAFEAASVLVPDIRGAAVCGAATGQAVSALFGRREERDGSHRTVCNNPRAILRYSEASNFRSLSNGRENNLKPVLLSVFSGQQVGDYTKNQELALVVPAHGYRCVPVFSAQPSMMGVFEDGIGEGFQQRFLYASAYSERIAGLPIPVGAPKRPDLTLFPFDSGTLPADWSPERMNAFYEGGGFNGRDQSRENGSYQRVVLEFPDSVRREVYAERIRINQDRGLDPREAHGTYLRMKIAAAFCLLDYPSRHSLAVNETDWELAGCLHRYSQSCYAENLREYARQRRERRADDREEEELAREEVDKRAQRDAEQRIIVVLSESDAASGVSKGEIYRKLSKRQRNHLDDALDNLTRSGRVANRKGRKNGDWYTLT